MFLVTFETLAKQKIQHVVCDLPDQMEGFENRKVRVQFASSISSTLRQLPDASKGIEKELLFRSAIISSAAASWGRKLLRVAADSEKRTPWWNQEVKEAIRAKKDAFKALLQDRSSSSLQSRYTDTKSGNFGSKEIVMGRVWSSFGFQLFWHTIHRLRGKRLSVTYSIKDSAGNILMDENEILSRWSKYFEDLLNPVKASTHDAKEVTHLGEGKVFTVAKVTMAI